MELSVKGIVLRQVPYGEKDAVMTILTEKGLVGFYAKGLLSLTSKNASSCLLYAYSDFMLLTRDERILLKKGELIHSHYELYESVEKMTALSLLGEITLKISGEEDGRLFSPFFTVLSLMDQNFDLLTLVTIFLYKAMEISGYALNVDECVFCEKKTHIVKLSYEKGGFLCRECFSGSKIDSNAYLKTCRYLHLVKEEHFSDLVLEEHIAKRLIHELLNYLKEKFGFTKWNGEELFTSTMNF